MRLSFLNVLFLIGRALTIQHSNTVRIYFQPRLSSKRGDQLQVKLFSIHGGQRSALDDDYNEPYIPPGEDDDSTPSSANIQFMITNRMRYILENDLGYLPEEVDEMEPQIVRQGILSLFVMM